MSALDKAETRIAALRSAELLVRWASKLKKYGPMFSFTINRADRFTQEFRDELLAVFEREAERQVEITNNTQLTTADLKKEICE